MYERTPFQNHLNTTIATQTQAADKITCQIGGTLRATVKNINLTPGDMITLLGKLPKNCHIISVEVNQFHHAESPEGEMYNNVKIDYQTDELMTKATEPDITVRGISDGPFDLGPNIVLCEHSQNKSDNAAKAAMPHTALHGATRLEFDDIKAFTNCVDIEKSVMRAAVHTEQPGMYYRFVAITKAGVMRPVMTVKDLDEDVIACVYDITNITRLKVKDAKQLMVSLVSAVCRSHATAGKLSLSHIDIDYIIAKFEQLKLIASVMGYHIRSHNTDNTDMELYYQPNYANLILILDNGN